MDRVTNVVVTSLLDESNETRLLAEALARHALHSAHSLLVPILIADKWTTLCGRRLNEVTLRLRELEEHIGQSGWTESKQVGLEELDMGSLLKELNSVQHLFKDTSMNVRILEAIVSDLALCVGKSGSMLQDESLLNQVEQRLAAIQSALKVLKAHTNFIEGSLFHFPMCIQARRSEMRRPACRGGFLHFHSTFL